MLINVNVVLQGLCLYTHIQVTAFERQQALLAI